ncbi:conserved protein of unknown function (plasmid) [Rhodovastum atsumiense]|uniref:Uncharacterized protein n=1 Tax=Rhodovastum atsumiense TaxID=504468 RepID=A0A5M6IMZ7_9PROT|nr:hypothetical protein [Rhodovastum atsumiense]KAA5609626.1 hypothetical protein F1189_22960 [Rhodovastum atsumiense]CAH2606488.1 conserved protein of unknown function [Rhodovastum atsumiense]
MPDPMTTDRAREINDALVTAWMVREQITCGPVPDLSGISLADAMEATEIVAALPGERQPDGSTILKCHIEEKALAGLLAWTLMTRLSQIREAAHG